MFNSKYLKYDIKAGIVVFLVALPLCLGIALAQKAPLFSGIISGIIGGIVVAMISGSKLSVSGPAAGLTSIVISAVATLGSYEAFLVAVVLAGIIQIVLGVIKAGVIGHYFPSAVIKGMLAAIGIILIIKQLPHLVGYDKDPEGDFYFVQMDGENTFSEVINSINFISPGTAIIGVISLLILTLLSNKKFSSNKILGFVPAPLLVVIISILLVEFMNNSGSVYLKVRDEQLVNLPDFSSFSDITSAMVFPDFSILSNPKVYETALIIGIVASLETLLSLEAVDKLDPDSQISPTNRELIAQGTGNILCGLIGGIPITSVIVRSSANISAGGKTQLSSIFHGLLLMVTVVIIPAILEMIPLSALASVLIFTGFKLANPRIFKTTYRFGLDQFIPFVVTIGVMLLTDLLKGVGAGLLVSIIFILRSQHKTPYKLMVDTIDGQKYYFLKLSQYVTFVNKGKIIKLLQQVEPGSKVHIDGGRSNFIDKDVLEIFTEFKHASKANNIEVILEEIEEVETITSH